MAFFTSSITVLQTLVVALGAGLGIWGAINLMEGYGNDNPGAKSQGMKQLMAGGGVALIGTVLVPVLGTLFGCGASPDLGRRSRLVTVGAASGSIKGNSRKGGGPPWTGYGTK